jgi:hypothetical protein
VSDGEPARESRRDTEGVDQLVHLRLDTDAGDPASSVRAAFSWSYQQLTGDAARLFRLLGVRPGPDISTPAASLAGIPPSQARRLLDELRQTSLLGERTPSRCALHDLLRAYAAELARTLGSKTNDQPATHRMLDSTCTLHTPPTGSWTRRMRKVGHGL